MLRMRPPSERPRPDREVRNLTKFEQLAVLLFTAPGIIRDAMTRSASSSKCGRNFARSAGSSFPSGEKNKYASASWVSIASIHAAPLPGRLCVITSIPNARKISSVPSVEPPSTAISRSKPATRPGLGYDGSMTSRHFRSLRTSMHIKASTPCLLIVELAQRRRDNRSFTRIRSAGRALEKLSLMTWPVDLVTSTVGIS